MAAHLERPRPGARERAPARSAASYRQARDSAPTWPRRVRAPAPCRRSDRPPALPGGSADASGRCRWCPPARPATPSSRKARDISPGRPGIWLGTPPSRNSRAARHVGTDGRGVRIDRHAAYGIAHALPRPARIASGSMSMPAVRPMRGTGARLGLACNRLFHADNLTWEPQPLPLRIASHSKNALAPYTIGGYISNMRKDIKASCAKRLNRIEGQVRGIARMVDGRPLLHRRRHADLGGPRCIAAAGRGNPARSRGALRRACDRVGQQGRAASEDRRADERRRAGGALTTER